MPSVPPSRALLMSLLSLAVVPGAEPCHQPVVTALNQPGMFPDPRFHQDTATQPSLVHKARWKSCAGPWEWGTARAWKVPVGMGRQQSHRERAKWEQGEGKKEKEKGKGEGKRKMEKGKKKSKKRKGKMEKGKIKGKVK